MKPVYFQSGEEFRKWLLGHSDLEPELLLGFNNKLSGGGGITYREAVDAALCFGWIDGVRHNVDRQRYTIRFTPRRARSIWSNINIRRVQELTQLGLMTAAGLKTFEARDPKRSGVYSFENRPRRLKPEYESQFRADRRAWAFFETRAPWYRRTASWWVMSAKKEETQRKRLATLIQDSAERRNIRPLSTRTKPTATTPTP